MPGERLFYTGSTRIIGDSRPSGLDHRVYACVSLHDGMSLLKSGRGCYATFATLTAEIGCDPANLSRSLKRLVTWGYLLEERQDDRRRKTYRVTFPSRDTWPNDQQSIVDQAANEHPEIVGNDEAKNGANPPQTPQHYSSLKGLDLSEEKLNSSEEARIAARPLSKTGFSENVGGQLAALDRMLERGEDINLVEMYRYIVSVWELDEHRGRATRLAEEVAQRMTKEEFERAVSPNGFVPKTLV